MPRHACDSMSCARGVATAACRYIHCTRVPASASGTHHCRPSMPYTRRLAHACGACRARYIELNLLYDPGVRFGLEGGRIESIMVSAPPRVRWQHQQFVAPAAVSPQADMLRVLRGPREWAA